MGFIEPTTVEIEAERQRLWRKCLRLDAQISQLKTQLSDLETTQRVLRRMEETRPVARVLVPQGEYEMPSMLAAKLADHWYLRRWIEIC
jgi:prefoldin subunit 5